MTQTPHKPRIQFVTPYLDGDYYGKIFFALHSEAKRRNLDLYVVQSLVSFNDPIAFPHQVGLEAADGWLLMTNPNSPLRMAPEVLQAIEAAGKPLVTIGYREDAGHAHAVVADNRLAAKEAVNHLIRQHGHRSIAFVGSPVHVDLIERYHGYLEALSENGIPQNDALIYEMADAMEPAGLAAGTAMVADGIAFTAIFAATDLIAQGLMETLQQAGVRIPEDVAIIGFDDLPSAAVSAPPLTTVRQNFTDYALLALERLDGLIRGERYDDHSAYLPTLLVHRASCGCSDTTADLPASGKTRNLTRSQASFNSVIQQHYQLTYAWAATVREERFDFGQLFSEHYRWGCLAQWENHGDGFRRLVVTQSYSHDELAAAPIGTSMPLEQFPPSSWFPNVGPNEFVHIHSIRNSRTDWGIIVVIRKLDELFLIPASDLAQTGFTIAHAALERDDLIRQVNQMSEKLTQLAYHDGLTGLANRQRFQDTIRQCMMEADRHGTKLGLLLLDLDRFKSINDTMGHQAGDELLVHVAECLSGVVASFVERSPKLRANSMAARLGGDEFVVLLDNIADHADLQDAMLRIQQRFAKPFTLLGQAVDSACSIGSAIYPDDGADTDELMRHADMNMYRVKASNRSRGSDDRR